MSHLCGETQLYWGPDSCAHVLSGIVSLGCGEVLTPGPVDASLFGNRVFAGVIG